MKLQGPARIMESLSDTCLVGDCREVLKTLIAEDLRVQMCVTSPPYWGLRDYGMAGQIGLERTPDDYMAVLVKVFRLVRELLADQGTLWLNNRGRVTMRGTKRSRSSPTISDLRNHSSPRCGCRAERGPSYSADCPSGRVCRRLNRTLRTRTPLPVFGRASVRNAGRFGFCPQPVIRPTPVRVPTWRNRQRRRANPSFSTHLEKCRVF
jgi:hypothetical protein